jgi:hypothetical protein
MVRRLRGNTRKFVAEEKEAIRETNEVAPSDISPWLPHTIFSSDNIYGTCTG